MTEQVSPDLLDEIKKKSKEMENNAKKLVDESARALRIPTAQEQTDLQEHNSPFINKFMVAMLRNKAVKLGFGVEYTPDQPATFTTAVVTTIHDVAALHNLLTRLLTSYQQQQQSMIQAAQAKVNPGFAKTLEALSEANSKG